MRETRVRTPARLMARGLAVGSAALVRWSWRHPRTSVSGATTGAAVVWLGYQTVLVAAGAAVVAGVSWRLLDQPTFDRFAGRLLRAWWRRWTFYYRKWQRTALRLGLSAASPEGGTVLPRLAWVRSSWCWDTVEVAMLDGQKPGQYEAVLDELANTSRARRATVRLVKPGRIALEFQRREPFDEMPVPLPALSTSVESVDLRKLPLAVDEYGRPFLLNLMVQYHLLLAGETGAGKGSWLWSLLWSLAPWIRAGLVRLWVIDPKGGQEFGQGRAMFAEFADNDVDGLALMEKYASVMNDRKQRLHTRTAPVTRETPLEVLICDELAAMMTWCDREIGREFERLLSVALTQYRSVGGRVIGATQEPTKDVIPTRGLFPFKIALRVAESNYVDMVLGEGARDRGALADQISEILPGVAYAKREGTREPVRARAPYVSDEDIAKLVDFCTAGATVTMLRPSPPVAAASGEDLCEFEEVDYFDGAEDDENDVA